MDNVIDFKTRKALLPFQVKALLMAQYADSKERGDGAEDFYRSVEEKLSTLAMSAVVDAFKSAVMDFNRSK